MIITLTPSAVFGLILILCILGAVFTFINATCFAKKASELDRYICLGMNIVVGVFLCLAGVLTLLSAEDAPVRPFKLVLIPTPEK